MEHIATSAKGIAAAGLLLISPVILLFMGPLAVGVSSDIVHEIGGIPTALGLSGAVALFAVYKLQSGD
jgi:hypothetical protein